MVATFIDTNALPSTPTPIGSFKEVLNETLAGAKNVLATVRWVEPGKTYAAAAGGKHQLLYFVEGAGSISLDGKSYDVTKGAGVYLGPTEAASITAGDAQVKLFHLEVPEIPK